MPPPIKNLPISNIAIVLAHAITNEPATNKTQLNIIPVFRPNLSANGPLISANIAQAATTIATINC